MHAGKLVDTKLGMARVTSLWRRVVSQLPADWPPAHPYAVTTLAVMIGQQTVQQPGSVQDQQDVG